MKRGWNVMIDSSWLNGSGYFGSIFVQHVAINCKTLHLWHESERLVETRWFVNVPETDVKLRLFPQVDRSSREQALVPGRDVRYPLLLHDRHHGLHLHVQVLHASHRLPVQQGPAVDQPGALRLHVLHCRNAVREAEWVDEHSYTSVIGEITLSTAPAMQTSPC